MWQRTHREIAFGSQHVDDLLLVPRFVPEYILHLFHPRWRAVCGDFYVGAIARVKFPPCHVGMRSAVHAEQLDEAAAMRRVNIGAAPVGFHLFENASAMHDNLSAFDDMEKINGQRNPQPLRTIARRRV